MEQEAINLSPLNTRVLKHNEIEYDILVASITKELESNVVHDFEGLKIKVIYGSFAPFLKNLNANLAKCIEFAEN